MVSNLLPLPVPGISGLSRLIDEKLLDANGNLRDMDVAAAEIGGWLPEVLGEYRLRTLLRRPKARGYPPRIFISYQWETPEHIAWTKELARRLREAGYVVYLDRDCLREDATPTEVFSFIANLAICDFALVVVSHEYPQSTTSPVPGVTSMRGWLYEEWRRIEVLRGWGLLEIVGVIRSGFDTTEHPRASLARFDNAMDLVIDVREDASGMDRILRFFGRYTGRRLTGTEHKALAAAAGSALASAEKGDLDTAATYLPAIAPYEQTEEFELVHAYLDAARGAKAAAMRRIEGLLGSTFGIPTADLLVDALRALGEPVLAMGLAAEIAESPSLWRNWGHMAVADLAFERGEVRTTYNHSNWLLQSEKLGQVRLWAWPPDLLESIGQNVAAIKSAAIQAPMNVYIRGLPYGEITYDRNLRCGICDAIYPPDCWVCMMCGTPHLARTKMCPLCGSSHLGKMTFCPTCKMLPAPSGDGHIEIHFSHRRPGKDSR